MQRLKGSGLDAITDPQGVTIDREFTGCAVPISLAESTHRDSGMHTLRDLREAMIAMHRQEIEKLRQQLKPLENGTVQTEPRRVGTLWIDVTAEQIALLKNGIAQYETSIARIQRDNAAAPRGPRGEKSN